MMSMWSQSAPKWSMRWASEAKLAKSEESIEGAIFGVTPILPFFLSTPRTERETKQNEFVSLIRDWGVGR